MQRALASILAFAFVGCAAQPPAPTTRVLVAQATPPAAAPPPSPAPAPASSDSRTSDPMARAYGWISISVGAAAGVVAIGTSFMMLHQKSVRDDQCDATKQCTQSGLDANTQLSALSGWNAGAYAVAAIGLGVGAFLVLTNPADKDKEIAAGVGPGGITLRGKF